MTREDRREMTRERFVRLADRKREVKESRRERFVRLAERRVSAALRDIRLIGNLSNKTNYIYNDDDVRKIYGALRKSLDEMKAKFDSPEAASEDTFKL